MPEKIIQLIAEANDNGIFSLTNEGRIFYSIPYFDRSNNKVNVTWHEVNIPSFLEEKLNESL